MFLESSRYYKIETSEGKAANGRLVKFVKFRRLPEVSGQAMTVKEGDRLDIIAQRSYDNPTWFWHIADADSELEANDLVAVPGSSIEVPEQ
jgi:hypothetical protein